jgi:hypothetical protein
MQWRRAYSRVHLMLPYEVYIRFYGSSPGAEFLSAPCTKLRNHGQPRESLPPLSQVHSDDR